jgi:hypothetical protein
MKKAAVLLLHLAIGTALSPGAAQAKICDVSRGLRVFETPVLNLQTPVGWRAEYQPQNRSIVVVSQDTECAFTISWGDAPAPYDLETEADLYFGQWKRRQPGIELGPESSHTSVAGVPALRRKVFSRSGDMAADIVVFQAAGKRIGLTMRAASAEYGAVAPVFETMLQSLHVPGELPGPAIRSAQPTVGAGSFRNSEISFNYPQGWQVSACRDTDGFSCVQLRPPAA